MLDIPTWTERWVHIKELDETICKERNKRLIKNLNENVRSGIKQMANYNGLFPVQEKTIPYILNSINNDVNNRYSNDVCISVPTGEGKTLCYVIPISNYLYDRPYPCLSVLVVVPTRELANQVRNVFGIFTNINKGRFPIKIATLTGQHSFSSEMKEINSLNAPDIVISTPGRLCEHYYQLLLSEEFSVNRDCTNTCMAGRCRHNKESGNDTVPSLFRDIYFIVIDEVDKLLSQTYNNWQEIVNRISKSVEFSESCGELGLSTRKPIKILLSATISDSPYKINQLNLVRPIYFISSISGESNIPSKMLQRYVKVHNKKHKPNSLLCLIYQLNLSKTNRKLLRKLISKNGVTEYEKSSIKSTPKYYKNLFKAIIFCSSKTTTSYLTSFLQKELSKSNRKDIILRIQSSITDDSGEDDIMEGVSKRRRYDSVELADDLGELKAEEFSSLLLQKERNHLIKRFNNNEFNIIVCSDILARGIDISNIDIVINYDVPDNIKTYIHRAGRTARAGKSGYTYTMVESNQMRHFMKLVNSKKRSVYRQKLYLALKNEDC